MGQAYQLQAIGSRVLCYISWHVSIRHPLRDHAEFEQFGRYAFDSQDVWMICSLANYNFLAVFLGEGSLINPQSSFQ